MNEAIGENDLPAHMRPLVQLWRERAGTRAWPDRREILFEELVPWLGRLHLVDVLDGDFRFAVYGTATVGVNRREYTGMRLSQIDDPLAPLWAAGYREAVEQRRPLFVHHRLGNYGEPGGPTGWWRAILPLGAGDRVEHLLVPFQLYRADGTFI
jgi:hypothetical protein